MTDEQKPIFSISAREVRTWLSGLLGVAVIACSAAIYNAVDGQKNNTETLKQHDDRIASVYARNELQDETLALHSRGLEMLICEHRRANGQTCDFNLTPRKD